MNLQRKVTHKTTTFPSKHSTSNQEQGSCSSSKRVSSLKRHIDIPSNDDGTLTIWLKHLFSRTCGAANTLPRCLRWPLHLKSISYTCPCLLARIWSCFYEAVSSSHDVMSIASSQTSWLSSEILASSASIFSSFSDSETARMTGSPFCCMLK